MKYKCLNNIGYGMDIKVGGIYDSEYKLSESMTISEIAKMFSDDWKEYNRKEKIQRIIDDEI